MTVLSVWRPTATHLPASFAARAILRQMIGYHLPRQYGKQSKHWRANQHYIFWISNWPLNLQVIPTSNKPDKSDSWLVFPAFRKCCEMFTYPFRANKGHRFCATEKRAEVARYWKRACAQVWNEMYNYLNQKNVYRVWVPQHICEIAHLVCILLNECVWFDHQVCTPVFNLWFGNLYAFVDG
jgi:hypothetical protein